MSNNHDPDRNNHREGSRATLRAIARRAMRQRGLLPEFSEAALTQTARTTRAAAADERDTSLRDLRGLLWASIDNDDSRDLDQLSAAEDAGGGAVRVYVAVADVDALVE